jgi:hypothetical protein
MATWEMPRNAPFPNGSTDKLKDETTYSTWSPMMINAF